MYKKNLFLILLFSGLLAIFSGCGGGGGGSGSGGGGGLLTITQHQTIIDTTLSEPNIELILGAQSKNENITKSKLTIQRSTIEGGSLSIFGGDIETFANEYFQSTGNSVLISDSYVHGVSGTGFSHERILITGGSVATGSEKLKDEVGFHTVKDNTVTISNSTIEDKGTRELTLRIFGGTADGPTKSDGHHVTNNAVSISGSKLIADGIYIGGGDASTGNFLNDPTPNSQVNNNSIYISDSTLTASDLARPIEIIGGTVFTFNTKGGGGKAINNTITFNGLVTLNSNDVSIAGGKVYNLTGNNTVAGDDARTGNTLVLDKAVVTMPTKVSRVFNFQNYVFTPSYDRIINITDPNAHDYYMLKVQSIDLGTNAHLTIKGNVGDGSEKNLVGKKFGLMRASGGFIGEGNFANIGDTFQLYQGTTIVYDVKATITKNNLTAEFITKKMTPQARVPAKSRAATTSMVTQASNFVSGPGINNALVATNMANSAGAPSAGERSLVGQTFAIPTKSDFDWASFSAVTAGSSRYNSGSSYVDVDTFSALSGIARRSSVSQGHLLYGVFFEYGKADLDTNNSFKNQSDIRGTGDSEYFGGGLLGRFDHKSGVYADASFRAGSISANHSSSDYQGFVGQKISYDTDSLYIGTHFALGYIWQIFEAGSLDLYGKYFWAHVTGNDVDVIGDEYTFDAINSHRGRIGARYTHAVNAYISPFFGAAFEYEFDGKAPSSVHGVALEGPDFQGSTGIFDLGFSLKPKVNSPITFDLSSEFFTGIREGYEATLQFIYEF